MLNQVGVIFGDSTAPDVWVTRALLLVSAIGGQVLIILKQIQSANERKAEVAALAKKIDAVEDANATRHVENTSRLAALESKAALPPPHVGPN